MSSNCVAIPAYFAEHKSENLTGQVTGLFRFGSRVAETTFFAVSSRSLQHPGKAAILRDYDPDLTKTITNPDPGNVLSETFVTFGDIIPIANPYLHLAYDNGTTTQVETFDVSSPLFPSTTHIAAAITEENIVHLQALGSAIKFWVQYEAGAVNAAKPIQEVIDHAIHRYRYKNELKQGQSIRIPCYGATYVVFQYINNLLVPVTDILRVQAIDIPTNLKEDFKHIISNDWALQPDGIDPAFSAEFQWVLGSTDNLTQTPDLQQQFQPVDEKDAFTQQYIEFKDCDHDVKNWKTLLPGQGGTAPMLVSRPLSQLIEFKDPKPLRAEQRGIPQHVILQYQTAVDNLNGLTAHGGNEDSSVPFDTTAGAANQVSCLAVGPIDACINNYDTITGVSGYPQITRRVINGGETWDAVNEVYNLQHSIRFRYGKPEYS